MNDKRSTAAATVTTVVSALVGLTSVFIAGLMTEEEWVCVGSAYRCLATTSPPEQKAFFALAGLCFIVAIVAHRSKSSEARAAQREAAGLAAAKFMRLRPTLIQQAKERDGGCRECGTTAAVDVYYMSVGPTQDKLQRFEWLVDLDNMVTLCPQHTKARNSRVAQEPVGMRTELVRQPEPRRPSTRTSPGNQGDPGNEGTLNTDEPRMPVSTPRADDGRRYRLAIGACASVLILVGAVAFGLWAEESRSGESGQEAGTQPLYQRPEEPRSAGYGQEYPPYEKYATNGFIRGLNAEIPWTVEVRASILVDSATVLCDDMRRGASRQDLLARSVEMGFEGGDTSTFVEITETWICRIADG